MNMSNVHVTLLVLLDLSTAFDTVDNTILIQRFQSEFGFKDMVPSWFSSYQAGHVQCVSMYGMVSDEFQLNWGVPQGSCLKPLLFTIHASKLFNIIESHLSSIYMYANDTKLLPLFLCR